MEDKEPELLFDEGSHEYSVQGIKYSSTTQIMQQYKLSADYGTIPPKVLANAAARGTQIHKYLEEYINTGVVPDVLGAPVPQVDLFHKYMAIKGIKTIDMKSERQYWDDQFRVAGTVDLQYEENGELVIADFKTTAVLHADSVAWQLSIYNYLVCSGDPVAYYFSRLCVYHFSKGKMYVKNIHLVDYDEVKALLQANLDGDATFNYTKNYTVISPGDLTSLVTMKRELKEMARAKGRIESAMDTIKARVLTNMKDMGDYKYKDNNIMITYSNAFETTRISKKLVQQLCDDTGYDIDKLCKSTRTGESVNIKLYK